MHLLRSLRVAPVAALSAASLLAIPAPLAFADDHAEVTDRGSYAPRYGTERYHNRRSIDGSFNNRRYPGMNAQGTQLFRQLDSDYGDGLSTLAGAHRKSAREISNAMAAQTGDLQNPYGASDFLWQWGQFVDHDIDLTPGASPAEPAPIAVPLGDQHFDPFFTGTQEIGLNRSVYDVDTGDDEPREQLNEITGWIDASNVYGSDYYRARELRALDGSGQLKTSPGDLLPFNVNGLPNANDVGAPPESLFLAGDVRSNEQVGLTAMHTLFVREHNRIAKVIKRYRPRWSDRRTYEYARKRVSALMQVITYEEFLPALLGPEAIAPYRGYSPTTDARISNHFSTAAYRFGHSALSPTLLRIEADGSDSAAGPLPLRRAFFNPAPILEEGIDSVLRGLAKQHCQKVDTQVVDDVRNFLFGPPGSGGFDLVSLNIQRGREHGLPSYNDAREAYGLGRAESFADVSSDPATQAKLAAAYDHPDYIDMWVGGLSEDPLPKSHVGPTFQAILVDQFEAVRDGDRFYYERHFPRHIVKVLKQTRLADIIRRNTDIGDELQDNVFEASAP